MLRRYLRPGRTHQQQQKGEQQQPQRRRILTLEDKITDLFQDSTKAIYAHVGQASQTFLESVSQNLLTASVSAQSIACNSPVFI